MSDATGLRDQLADAIRKAAHWCDGRCDCNEGDHDLFVTEALKDRVVQVEGTPESITDAVMPVVEAAIAEQRRKVVTDIATSIERAVAATDLPQRDRALLLEIAACARAALDQPEETRRGR